MPSVELHQPKTHSLRNAQDTLYGVIVLSFFCHLCCNWKLYDALLSSPQRDAWDHYGTRARNLGVQHSPVAFKPNNN